MLCVFILFTFYRVRRTDIRYLFIEQRSIPTHQHVVGTYIPTLHIKMYIIGPRPTARLYQFLKTNISRTCICIDTYLIIMHEKKVEFVYTASVGIRYIRDILTAGTNYILMNTDLMFGPVTLSSTFRDKYTC